MNKKSFIPISEYFYDLPADRIAKYPLPRRDQSKLLVYKNSTIHETNFIHIPDILPPESFLFINNTKVVHARIKFRRKTGSVIEIFCLSPFKPVDYQLAFSSTGTCSWKCTVGNLKKWKDEPLEYVIIHNQKKYILRAEKVSIENNEVLVRFSWDLNMSFGEIIEIAGIVPIPPYLNRESEPVDNERYQTIYSKIQGSVAAPTAGFHFTPEIMNRLKEKSIYPNEITLHVSAGTFQPVKSGNALDHIMHEEFFSLKIDTLKELATGERPIIATGTTTLRTLESIYWLSLKSIRENKLITHLGQWDHNELKAAIPFNKAVSELATFMEKNNKKTLTAETGIMIIPGYTYRAVDILITNFHQPQSTLLLLVAAFIGNDWKQVYSYALDHDFRFLSYGDSSVLWKKAPKKLS